MHPLIVQQVLQMVVLPLMINTCWVHIAIAAVAARLSVMPTISFFIYEIP